MTFDELTSELDRRGVQLERDGQSDRLRYRAPKGTVTDLLPDIARFKPSLLERLEHEQRERAAFLAGADFRAWHWRAIGAPWSVGFYSDWPQFARVHCSRAGGASLLAGPDVATLERAIFADEWCKIARRVLDHLNGEGFNLKSETTP